MKKLVALVITLVITLSLILTLSFGACAEGNWNLVKFYSYQEVLEYDSETEELGEVAIANGRATFGHLIAAIGGIDVAEVIDLSIAVFPDGGVSIRHLAEDGGYLYHLVLDAMWYNTQGGQQSHMLLPLEQVRSICADCAYAANE